MSVIDFVHFKPRIAACVDHAETKRGRIVSQDALQRIEIVGPVPMAPQQLHRDLEEGQKVLDGHLDRVGLRLKGHVDAHHYSNLIKDRRNERDLANSPYAERKRARVDLANQSSPCLRTNPFADGVPSVCFGDLSLAKIANPLPLKI